MVVLHAEVGVEAVGSTASFIAGRLFQSKIDELSAFLPSPQRLALSHVAAVEDELRGGRLWDFRLCERDGAVGIGSCEVELGWGGYFCSVYSDDYDK